MKVRDDWRAGRLLCAHVAEMTLEESVAARDSKDKKKRLLCVASVTLCPRCTNPPWKSPRYRGRVPSLVIREEGRWRVLRDKDATERARTLHGTR